VPTADTCALEALMGSRDPVEHKIIFVDWLKFSVAALLISCVAPYGFGSFAGEPARAQCASRHRPYRRNLRASAHSDRADGC
jgi:hypothetical protein